MEKQPASLTLLDYFAAHALPIAHDALRASVGEELDYFVSSPKGHLESLITSAYSIAYVMMKTRKDWDEKDQQNRES